MTPIVLTGDIGFFSPFPKDSEKILLSGEGERTQKNLTGEIS